MNLNEYQDEAMRTAIYRDKMYPVLGLAEEAGEVCGKLAKFVRDGGDKEVLRTNLKKELGDVLWMVAAIASDHALSLDDIAQANIEKLRSRAARGVLGGSGDNR